MRSVCYVTAAAFLAGALLSPGAWACAVCGVDDSAYIVSYLFLTGMSFSVVGIIGGVLIYSLRRNGKKSLDA